MFSPLRSSGGSPALWPRQLVLLGGSGWPVRAAAWFEPPAVGSGEARPGSGSAALQVHSDLVVTPQHCIHWFPDAPEELATPHDNVSSPTDMKERRFQSWRQDKQVINTRQDVLAPVTCKFLLSSSSSFLCIVSFFTLSFILQTDISLYPAAWSLYKHFHFILESALLVFRTFMSTKDEWKNFKSIIHLQDRQTSLCFSHKPRIRCIFLPLSCK